MAYYITRPDMLYLEAKIERSIYPCNTQFIGRKESVIYFTFVVVCYYWICFKYVSLCNVIKLVTILIKYAANKQTCSQKD